MYPSTSSQCTVGIWQTIRCTCAGYSQYVHYVIDEDYDKKIKMIG